MTLRTIWYNQIYRNYAYAFFKDFSFFVAVLVTFFTDWGHISLFQVQLIQSWFSFWVFVLEVPTGAVADRIGRKHALVIGALTIALAELIYGSTPHFVIFLLAEFIFALGYALTSGADQALIYDTLKEQGKEGESKKVLGRADGVRMLGMLISAPLGSLIATRFGLNAPVMFTAIPLAIAAAIGMSLREPKTHSEGSESPDYLTIVKTGIHNLAHHPVVRMLAIDSLLVASAVYFVIWFYQPLLQGLHVPIIYFGFVQSLLLLSEIVVSSNFAFFEKFLGAGTSYIKSTALITTLAFVVVAAFPSVPTVLALIIFAGGFGYTRSTYIVAMVSKHINSKERATVLSSMSMLRRLAIFVLNPLIGLVATNSLYVALLLVGILPLATFLLEKSNQHEV